MISFSELMEHLGGKSKAARKEHITMPPQGEADSISAVSPTGKIVPRDHNSKQKAARKNQRRMHRIKACRPTY